MIRSASAPSLPALPQPNPSAAALQRVHSVDSFVLQHGPNLEAAPHAESLTPPCGKTKLSRAARACPMHRAPRIVLTGGPCGGKSTILPQLRQALEARGLQVYAVPEAATLVISAGRLPPVNGPKGAWLRFQRGLARLQMSLEDMMNEGAEDRGVDRSVVLCDRGLADSKAYVDRDLLEELLQNMGLEEDDLGKNRYDLVLHLVTAADGAEEHYNWTGGAEGTCNNAARTDSPEQAVKLDNKVAAAWDKHPYRFVFTNQGQSFACKKDTVIRVACDFMKDRALHRASATQGLSPAPAAL